MRRQSREQCVTGITKEPLLGRGSGWPRWRLREFLCSGCTALVGLTEIPADLEVGDAPSILRLLDENSDAAPPGLTPWDSAFLHALYHSDQGNTTQRSEIAVQMVHEVAR